MSSAAAASAPRPSQQTLAVSYETAINIWVDQRRGQQSTITRQAPAVLRMVASFLDIEDIAAFSQTARSVLAACLPLWHRLWYGEMRQLMPERRINNHLFSPLQACLAAARENAYTHPLQRGIEYREVFGGAERFGVCRGELIFSVARRVDLFCLSLSDLARDDFRATELRSGHTSEISALAFSKDFFASGDRVGTMVVWRGGAKRVSARPMHLIRGHLDGITALSFSIDGKTLFSGSKEGVIKIWKFRKNMRAVATLFQGEKHPATGFFQYSLNQLTVLTSVAPFGGGYMGFQPDNSWKEWDLTAGLINIPGHPPPAWVFQKGVQQDNRVATLDRDHNVSLYVNGVLKRTYNNAGNLNPTALFFYGSRLFCLTRKGFNSLCFDARPSLSIHRLSPSSRASAAPAAALAPTNPVARPTSPLTAAPVALAEAPELPTGFAFGSLSSQTQVMIGALPNEYQVLTTVAFSSVARFQYQPLAGSVVGGGGGGGGGGHHPRLPPPVTLSAWVQLSVPLQNSLAGSRAEANTGGGGGGGGGGGISRMDSFGSGFGPSGEFLFRGAGDSFMGAGRSESLSHSRRGGASNAATAAAAGAEPDGDALMSDASANANASASASAAQGSGGGSSGMASGARAHTASGSGDTSRVVHTAFGAYTYSGSSWSSGGGGSSAAAAAAAAPSHGAGGVGGPANMAVDDDDTDVVGMPPRRNAGASGSSGRKSAFKPVGKK